MLYGGALFNTACLIADGQIAGLRGQAESGRRGHPLRAALVQAVAGRRACVDRRSTGTPYPLGDLIFDCGDVRIGFEICEDAWVADRPGGDLAARGVDIILNPSASHFAFGKHAVRQRFVLEGSRAFNVSYVYANLLGNEAGRAIYDGDAMIASAGQMLATGPRFSFADYQLTTAVIDVEQSRMQRAAHRQLPAPARSHRSDYLIRVSVQLSRRPAGATASPCRRRGRWAST